MPYNTRRKSLSLTLLGVHVPVSHAERAAAAAAAATGAAAAGTPSTHQNLSSSGSSYPPSILEFWVLSSGDDDDDAHAVSESFAEVDLSPDFDDMVDDMNVPVTPIGSFSKTVRMPRSLRSASPPLEKDEREFTQTADGLHKRKLSGEPLPGCGEHVQPDDLARDDLFGDRSYIAAGSTVSTNFMASPAFRATFPPSSTRKETEDNWLKFGKSLEWDYKPEDIELDELDCLLDAC
ncbi:conserved hypothetical protein [Verticillium alfalfae VaMs.102]|uniref:Mucin n=1 Tax=Verticillium alfalfae (strain VaMs.102 / ATCC MYA-4576 / FGSC 10136) TaxID=526221 RepID=C9SWP5_VERA1|nr:conserved hypothetical protein [Verticillium alfalfae VaMs.102]EEY23210.1 conserved hypothetical protein [Verticillium alfalfae VaMs.102]